MTELRQRLRRVDDEQGAIAIIVALFIVVLFLGAAYAVDIGNQVAKRQALQNTFDSAAIAGSGKLPGSMADARTAVGVSLANNDPATYGASGAGCGTNPAASGCPQPTFYCIVPRLSSGQPDLSLIAPTLGTSTSTTACDPGSAGTLASYVWQCSTQSSTCYIKFLTNCDTGTPTCSNPSALSVTGSKPVPFVFGPIVGDNSGTTGLITSVACGACGSARPKDLDLVVIADRTGSMRDADPTTGASNDTYTTSEGKAIKAALESFDAGSNPQVALGTVGITNEAGSVCSGARISPSSTAPSIGSSQQNSWVPVGFDATFLDSSRTLKTSSDALGQAVTCLANSTTSSSPANSGTGTWLASPLKIASQVLVPQTSTNPVLNDGLAARASAAKAIIFETDEQPNAQGSSNCSSTPSLCQISNTTTLGNATEKTECQNFKTVADNAKALGIAIAIVIYNPGSNANCTALLGLGHDPVATQDPSTGAYFVYSATNAADLAKEFKQAVVDVSRVAKLIQLP
jgi:Flp pilus assembly protein TadG